MARLRFYQSVVTRLVACLVLGGLVASAGTSFLEISRSESLLQMEVTQQVVLMTRNLQTVLRALVGRGDTQDLANTLNVFTANAPVTAVRLTQPNEADTITGKWPSHIEPNDARWILGEHATASGIEIDIHRPTYVQAPFHIGGKQYKLAFIIDGPGAREAMRSREISRLLMQWLFLAVTVLLGLLLVRRWFTGPLSDVVDHVQTNARADAFYRLSREYTGEFSQLADAVGGMLTRIECTTQALHHREMAFEHLYQFAPAAMVSIDKAGRIIEANRRAAQMFGVADEKQLVGATALDFVRREDRPLLRQTIDRLDLDPAARCELRLEVPARTLDLVVECAGVRDDDGLLRSIRLSLLDVSESKKLQRQLTDQTQLLNLIIDHMSDAILLVDSEGKVAAFNQQLVNLLHVRPESLRGQNYDPQMFWDDLGPLYPELLINRLRQIEADTSRPAIERVETRVGTFMFQGIPVQDAAQRPVGRLWVVQETTSHEQNQRLLSQQMSQLQALKRLGQDLAKITDVSEVQVKASELLYRIFDVEAVGIALRSDDPLKRSRQIIHRGVAPYLLGPSMDLVSAIETKLMRQVLGQNEIMFWPDLPKAMDWSKAFTAAGLTCVAAGPLRAGGDDQGILWIARRGGERLEPHHIYLLETLLPVISARIEVAQLNERLRELELTDSVTELPAIEPFRRAVHRLETRPGQPWSVLVFKLEHFRRINQLLSHQAADQLLRTVAQDLAGSLRRSCFVARLDGVSFGVLAPAHALSDAVTLADRLRQRVADHSVTMPDGSTWRMSASVGVAALPDDIDHHGCLIELAMHRANLARAHGHNCVVYEGSITPDRAAG